MQTTEIIAPSTTSISSSNKKGALFIPNAILIPLIFITFALTSSKWIIAVAPWLAYTFILRFIRQNKWKKALLISWALTFIAALIAQYKVVPLPTPIFCIIFLVMTSIALIPYSIDKWLNTKINNLSATLVFPSLMVSLDFIVSQGNSGTWGNIAYLQFSNIYLMQLASVTGIWGISFMVYWFASCANYIFEHPHQAKKVIGLYGIVFLSSISFGFMRLQVANSGTTNKVKVAGITTENLALIETIYTCHTNKSIKVSPKAFQSDAAFSESFGAMIAYAENPTDTKFDPVRSVNEEIISNLYITSQKAVEQGAKIISWSEGIVLTTKPEETKYIQAAKDFAKKQDIWFFFPMAAIISGKVIQGEPFIENKVLTINPEGTIVNTYFKNIPVGGVEPCFPGDGLVPVFETVYGNLSPVICYDADFPQLLKQTGQQATQLLVVPSGDWYDIAKMHAYMAITRGIENGVSMLRPVSKGLMVASDNYGQIIEKDNYFEDDSHLLIAEVPMQQVDTIYSRIGDVFVYMCMLIFMIVGISGIFSSKGQSNRSSNNAFQV